MKMEIKELKPFGVMISSISKNESASLIKIELLKELFHKYQIVILRNFSSFKDNSEFEDFCERFGKISLWPFGKVLELKEKTNPEDHIFDHSYMPMHWDGMYREEIPEYQIFHCAKAPNKFEGGETTFSNTKMILEKTSDSLKKTWREIEGKYQRKMEFYHSKVTSPLITKHPFKNYEVIRYSEPHDESRGDLINLPKISFSGKNSDSFHRELKEVLYHKDYFYAHKWMDGDIVIADNLTLLHGREKFRTKSVRHLKRIQVLSDIPYKNERLETFK